MRYSSRYVSTSPRRSTGKNRYPSMRRHRGSLRIPPVALLISAAVILVGAVAGGIMLLSSGGGSKGGNTQAGVNASARIHSGITIDGVAVGGMTVAEAEPKLEAAQQQRVDKLGVSITDGSSTLKIDSKELKYSFDTDSVLASALAMKSAGELKTTLNVDYTDLEQQVREYAASLSRPATNAMVLSFDRAKPAGQQFTCSYDVPGVSVDADTLWASVKKAFDDGTYGTVQAAAVPVQAQATKDWVEKSMKLIRSIATKMYDHSAPRLTNIKQAAAAVSGKILLPGETFSFNNTTGPRTAAQGYRKAHVINAGVEDNGMAGGVCQVSGTLFNAAVRSGLEIVSRTPHTAKSQYLDRGQDATVDYGHKDLVFKNNGATPVLIYITVDTKTPWQVTAEIYGQPLPDGETIELDSTSEVTELPALDTWRAEDSEAVDPGEYKIENPRKGYRINVYVRYLKNGTEYDRRKLDTVTYPATGTTVLYYPGDTPPPQGMMTLPPSPTPSALPDTPPPTQEPTQEPTQPPQNTPETTVGSAEAT